MRNRLINLLIFALMWLISYHYGVVQGAAYDDVWNVADAVAIISGLLGIWYFYKAVQWNE